MGSSPEYAAWYNMRERCRNPRHNSHKNYGARGLVVCDRWRESFQAFLEDMGPRPGPELTLERIDNERGYEPGNCRWATRKEQLANRRLYRGGLQIDGETLSLREAMTRYGFAHRSTIRYRLKQGMSIAEALKTPSNRARASHGP